MSVGGVLGRTLVPPRQRSKTELRLYTYALDDACYAMTVDGERKVGAHAEVHVTR
jgi:hypothetical protein